MSGTAVTIKHGVVTLKDATGTPLSLNLAETNSGLTVEGLEEGNYEAVPVMYREEFAELVQGKAKVITGSLELGQDGVLTHASTKKPLDAVMKTGAFAAGVTRDPGGVIWTTDIEWVGTRATVASSFRLRNCRIVAGFKEGLDPSNKITLNFSAYGTGTGNQFAFL